MTRKSVIDRHNLGEKVISFAMAGMPQNEIRERLEIEHPGVTLTPNNISRYLKSHIGNTAIAPLSPEEIHEIKTLSIDSVVQGIAAAATEAKDMYERFKDDPTARETARKWFKGHFEILTNQASMLGLIGPSSQVNVAIGAGQPPDGKTGRCQDCPLKDKFSKEVLKELLSDPDPEKWSPSATETIDLHKAAKPLEDQP